MPTIAGCLDEETVLAFCDGRLPLDARARAEQHLDGCADCRQLVSAIAQTSLAGVARGAPDSPLPLAPTAPAGRAPMTLSSRPRIPVAEGDILEGRYRVERVIGAGGMGVVVAARHLELDQRVALKFLLPEACAADGAVERFLREGKAAARLDSEHVARVLGTGRLDGGAPYLVLEYLEGSDLGALLAARGRLSVAEAAAYVLQACEALAIAHARGVVHRDVKPSNLFLTERADGSPLVKVLDFGISKVAEEGRSTLTTTSSWMGSPHYMSPEQMLSPKLVDARTDVWALGVVLFELVSGRRPWIAETLQGVCALVAAAEAPPLRHVAPDAPAALEAVVARCLVKAPEGRFAGIAALAEALAPFATGDDEAPARIARIARVSLGPLRASGDRSEARDDAPWTAASASAMGTPPAAVAAAAMGTSPSGRRRRSAVLAVVALAAGAAMVVVALELVGGRRDTSTGSALPADARPAADARSNAETAVSSPAGSDGPPRTAVGPVSSVSSVSSVPNASSVPSGSVEAAAPSGAPPSRTAPRSGPSRPARPRASGSPAPSVGTSSALSERK